MGHLAPKLEAIRIDPQAAFQMAARGLKPLFGSRVPSPGVLRLGHIEVSPLARPGCLGNL